MSAIDLTRKAEYATIIQQFKLRAINSAGECHLHMVEVEGSNPPSPTNRNLKRTTLSASRFRFFLFAVVFLRRYFEPFRSRHWRGEQCVACFPLQSWKRRFMPRKPLDMRKACGRLFANGKQKAPWGVWSWLFA